MTIVTVEEIKALTENEVVKKSNSRYVLGGYEIIYNIGSIKWIFNTCDLYEQELYLNNKRIPLLYDIKQYLYNSIL